jgi:hypothetical protein
MDYSPSTPSCSLNHHSNHRRRHSRCGDGQEASAQHRDQHSLNESRNGVHDYKCVLDVCCDSLNYSRSDDHHNNDYAQYIHTNTYVRAAETRTTQAIKCTKRRASF